MPKVTHKSATQHKTKLDTWAGIICKGREGGCEKCATHAPEYEAHHIVKRRFLSTRWLQSNLLKVCLDCHDFLERNPELAHQYHLEAVGEYEFDMLHTMKEILWTDLRYTVGEVKEFGELPSLDVLVRFRRRKNNE